MIETKGIKDSRIDYEAIGCIRSSSAAAIGMYIFAGVLIIAGIIVYFAVIPEILVFPVFVFLAALSVLMGLSAAKHMWYWGIDRFTIIQLFSKPATFSYREIDQVFTVTEGPAVTLIVRMLNGKEYGVSLHADGAQAFLDHLRTIQNEYPG
ncbi:MAG: hypothetical protein ACI4XF_12405 [Oscillospiraceae bacterium]